MLLLICSNQLQMHTVELLLCARADSFRGSVRAEHYPKAPHVFGPTKAVAPPDVDPCTFVYYKSYKDAAGAVHPAPFPVSCSASDRWRNNHCPVDADLATEQDWMQFLWSWHTTALDNDVGNMYSIFKATCQCSIDPATGIFDCAAPAGCTYNATSGAMECDAVQNCQPGSTTCDIPDCESKAAFWDWPSAGRTHQGAVP